jgi:branched-chain amino acid transport system ATP-binding protein
MQRRLDREKEHAPALLRTEALTKRFHGFTAVDGVTLDVMPGSIHALIGPNGAGKSTVFNLVTRFLQPTSGRIYYRGEARPNFELRMSATP